MRYYENDIYNALQSGEQIPLYMTFTGSLMSNTSYCTLNTVVNGKTKTICTLEQRMLNRDEATVKSLLNFVELLNRQAELNKGVSFKSLFMTKSPLLIQAINNGLLVVLQSDYITPVANNICTLEQIGMLLALLGYNFMSQQTAHGIMYIVKK